MIRREFFISKLKQKVQKYIENCIVCILANRKRAKEECLLNPISKDDGPVCTYHIDHLGPMEQTQKSYKYILTIVDGFTKFVWIYLTKTLTTNEVIQKLEHQQAVFGNPRRIISDRGPTFTSNVFEDYCEQLNIEHVKINTGVPRGNGQVERMHTTIILVLTKLCENNPSQWYKFTCRVQQVHNNTIQRSIKCTPIELLTSVKMNIYSRAISGNFQR